MTAMVSYQEWTTRYMRVLKDAGATDDDATTAVVLSWDILRTHEACYGADSATPVNFLMDSTPETKHAAAGCSAPRFGGEEFYIVYVPDLAERMSILEDACNGQIPRSVLVAGVAIHEVRHRVQDRESATLNMFRRDRLEGLWPDKQMALIALHMSGQFAEDERDERAAGVAQEDLARIFSDDEYDAAVVERLYLHRYLTISTEQQLAALIRMNCPCIPTRRP